MHIRLIPYYIIWHYTRGLKDFLQVMQQLLKVIIKIFSLPAMFVTFFQPFERLGERYHGGVSAFFETFIVNTLMRMVGIIVRTCIILLGIIALMVAVVFALVSLVLWVAMPAIIAALLFICLSNIMALL